MGRIIKIVKNIYGKVKVNCVKTILQKFLHKRFTIKENNVEVKIDKKFINEYMYSNYSILAMKKIKNIKANIAYYLDEIVENSGHIIEENNVKKKHRLDARLGFEKYIARFIIEDNKGNIGKYMCTIVVRCPNSNEKYLYDIVEIKKIK